MNTTIRSHAALISILLLALAATAAAQTAPATAPAPATATAPATAPAPAPAPAMAKPDRAEWLTDTGRETPGAKMLLGNLDPAASRGYLFELEMVNTGAAINTLKLAEHFATVKDKLLYGKLKNHAEYARIVEEDRLAAQRDPSHFREYGGHYSLLNPVGAGAETHLPFATLSLTVSFADANGNFEPAFPINLKDLSWKFAGRTPVSRPADNLRPAREGEQAQYQATFHRDVNFVAGKTGDYRPHLRLTKSYAAFKNDYSFEVRLAVENLTDRPMRFSVNQLGPTGLPNEDVREDKRSAAYGKWNPTDKTVQVILKPQAEITQGEGEGTARIYKLPSDQALDVGLSDDPTPQLWLGHVNKFFGSMVYLRPMVEERLDAATLQANFYVMPTPESPFTRTFLTGFNAGLSRSSGGPVLQVNPKAVREISMDVFAGPKKRDMFVDASAPHHRKQYEVLGYQNTIDLKTCCTVDQLTLAMMWLLQAIATLTFGNYGIAIIVLVILVRAALHPLTKKSQVSMMRMQKFKPEIDRIQKKYADDKEALQREMMKFYKQQGPAQILGCLPMFLQMPIWVALWTSLNALVELRHAAFLPVWITDLAAPDALISWHHAIEIPLLSGMIGPIHSLNLLPLLLTVAMYLQTKYTPQATSVAQTPEQEKQQRMMRVMMPVMMLLIFYSTPSGLTLYVMASTLGGVLEQWVIRKHIRERQELEAQTTTVVKAPGKGSRDSRPKKPRGPFWTKGG